MKLLMHLPEFFVCNVGVNLGGSDGAVPEHFLDRANVGAIHQEFRGIAVAKGMRGHFFDNACLAGIFADNGLNAYSGEAASLIIEDISFSSVHEERFVIVFAEGDIGFDAFGGMF